MDPKDIAKLISEEIEGEFHECPECGTEYAMTDQDRIWCLNPKCSNYDKEWASVFEFADPETRGYSRSAVKMAAARAKHKYEGKSGRVVMKTIRERIKARSEYGDREEMERKKRHPYHSLEYAERVTYRAAKDEATKCPRCGAGYASIDPARCVNDKCRNYDADWANDMWRERTAHETKIRIDTPVTIEFDDFIDKGHYYVLFVRLTKPHISCSYTPKSCLGKYAKLRWEFPYSKRDDINRGEPIVTRTHRGFAVTKRNIAQMFIEDKQVDPMNWQQEFSG